MSLFPLLKRRAAPSFRSILAVAAKSRLSLLAGDFALSASEAPGRPKLQKDSCRCGEK
jgi:hypothetical protein